jgi:hypothetical protein
VKGNFDRINVNGAYSIVSPYSDMLGKGLKGDCHDRKPSMEAVECPHSS